VFSGAQARRSIEQSLARLGLERVPLLYLHDPEKNAFADMVAPGGPIDVLLELRESGVAGAVGVAGGDVAAMTRYLELDVFDVLLTHNRWSLVNRNADALIDQAALRGMGVVNAAVFGGGILAVGTERSSRYAYREATPDLINAIREVEHLCREHGVSLAAAALQFSLRDARIASTVVGVSRPKRIEETLSLAATPIPEALWAEVDRVVSVLPSSTGPQ